MSLQDQARKLVIRDRNRSENRQDSALGRAANEVGLTVNEATTHNWKSHTH